METLIFGDDYEGDSGDLDYEYGDEDEDEDEEQDPINVSNTQTHSEITADHFESADGFNVQTREELEDQQNDDKLDLYSIHLELSSLSLQ
jgi:hypothetical protein